MRMQKRPRTEGACMLKRDVNDCAAVTEFRCLVVIAALGLVACQGTAGSNDKSAVTTGESTADITGGQCPSGSTVPGVDVSAYQDSINWAAVAASGQKFAIARVSDGTGYIDPYFAGNWANMKAAGLIRGAYQFFEPSEDAVAQANIVVARVGRLGPGDLPVMLDMEVTDGQSPATITAQIHRWVNTIAAGTGKMPMVYSGAYFWDDSVGTSDFASLPFVIAWYGNNCPGVPNAWAGTHWTFHQYSSSGSVPGIPDAVDMDIYNGTLAQLEAFAGGQAASTQCGAAPALPPAPTACGSLAPGEGLAPGASVFSCDGRFQLVMQGDGNLVLYSSGVPMWDTGTGGMGGYVAVMQGDGNFVLYSKEGCALWNSQSAGHPGASLAVQGDGNAVVYAGATALWSSRTGGIPPGPTGCGMLGSNEGLAPGEHLTSCEGKYTLWMQDDGNFVLYHNGVGAIWASSTVGPGFRFAAMQGDGNLVVYSEGTAEWYSHTAGHAGAVLAVQDDGNLVIYQGNTPIWASGTAGR